MWKTILVPHDFSPCASDALELARALAVIHGAEIVLLHVANLPENVPSDALIAPSGTPVPVVEHAKAGACRKLEEIALPLRRDGFAVQTMAAAGEIADEILLAANARKADVLVLGTHGRAGLSHLFLGSVAESVVRRSTVPVVSVRSTSPEAEPTDEERDAEDELAG